MTSVALTGSALLGIAIWFGALLLLLLVAGSWLVDRLERLRARRERRRHPTEVEAMESVERDAPAMPALRAHRPRFRLGPLRRYLGQGRVNPIDRSGTA